jgi:hypothetical protein
MPYATIIKWVLGAVGGLVIAWALYAGIIRPVLKPNPSTAQKAETIYNYYNQPRVSFGCAAWDIPKKELQNDVK